LYVATDVREEDEDGTYVVSHEPVDGTDPAG